MRTTRRGLGNERGTVLVLVAVTLVGVLAFAAFAIDLASLRDTKAQAQRAADAVALAGASAFRDFPSLEGGTKDSAWIRARNLARLNQVGSDTLNINNPIVDSASYGAGYMTRVVMPDLTLYVIPDSQKVRAEVRRAGIRTSFGKLLGVPFGNVKAVATAWASNAGPTVNCLKPFLLPDMWQEESNPPEDVGPAGPDGNIHTDPDPANPPENWTYDQGTGDRYLKFDPSAPVNPLTPQTGYGSGLRDATTYPGDVGLPLQLMPPGNPAARQGYFALTPPAGRSIADQIANADGCIGADVGGTPDVQSSPNLTDLTAGVRRLIAQDPGATWNQSAKVVTGSTSSDWTKSPRVITIALMDPVHIEGTSLGQQPDGTTRFNNFARVWLDDDYDPADPPGTIRATFLGFATGTSGGATNGTLVKQLQLIQ